MANQEDLNEGSLNKGNKREKALSHHPFIWAGSLVAMALFFISLYQYYVLDLTDYETHKDMVQLSLYVFLSIIGLIMIGQDRLKGKYRNTIIIMLLVLSSQFLTSYIDNPWTLVLLIGLIFMLSDEGLRGIVIIFMAISVFAFSFVTGKQEYSQIAVSIYNKTYVMHGFFFHFLLYSVYLWGLISYFKMIEEKRMNKNIQKTNVLARDKRSLVNANNVIWLMFLSCTFYFVLYFVF